MSKKKIAVISALSVVFAFCVGYIGYFIYNTYYIPHQEDAKNDELRNEYHIEEPDDNNSEDETALKIQFSFDDAGNLIRIAESTIPAAINESTAEQSSDSSQAISNSNAKGLNRIRELNGKVKAWLYIKGTNIDYPVVQGSDNEYYLDHDLNGYKNINGAIYLDCGVDLSKSQNIVIYGHYMNAGVMFHDLFNYKYYAFGQSHNAYLDIGDGYSKNWTLVGVITCSKEEASEYCITSFNRETIKKFINSVKSHRLYTLNTEMLETDQYLTLVTCSYEKKNYREIVVFKRT